MNTLKDRRAFEETALPHRDSLYGHALKLTMNRDDANDLLQDTFLKAYRFWDQFEPGTNIRAWLYQIMKNSYINFYRKRAKQPRKVELDEDTVPVGVHEAVSSGSGQIGEVPSAGIFGDEVVRSLDSLPALFRNVLLQSDLEDMTYEEIAAAIGCPVGTVRSRLHRSRKHMQKRLFRYAKQNGYILREV